jgi:hypothetical protein
VKSLVEVARRGRVACLPDDVFIVPEPALELLQSLGVNYQELGQDRETLRQRAFARMKEGIHLGGPPYAEREELYDRFDR